MVFPQPWFLSLVLVLWCVFSVLSSFAIIGIIYNCVLEKLCLSKPVTFITFYLLCVHVLYLSLVGASSNCIISWSHLLVCFFSNSESRYFLKPPIQSKIGFGRRLI